jgi:hypothetical protein
MNFTRVEIMYYWDVKDRNEGGERERERRPKDNYQAKLHSVRRAQFVSKTERFRMRIAE